MSVHPLVVGIDYSTTGEHWCFLQNTNIQHIYHLPYKRGADLATKLATREYQPIQTLYGTETRLDEVGDYAWAAVEGYVHHYDRGGKLAGVHWAIRARLAFLRRSTLELAPGRWKKEIGLPGNANKEAIKLHVQQLYPELPARLPQDAYDAVGIARAAQRIVYTGQTD